MDELLGFVCVSLGVSPGRLSEGVTHFLLPCARVLYMRFSLQIFIEHALHLKYSKEPLLIMQKYVSLCRSPCWGVY